MIPQPICAKCNKLARVEITANHQGIHITALCHGEKESVLVPKEYLDKTKGQASFEVGKVFEDKKKETA